MKASTLLKLLLGLVLLVVLGFVLHKNFMEAQARSMYARWQSDMRTFATALEYYHADNGAYPPMAMQLDADTIAVPTTDGQTMIPGATVDRFAIPTDAKVSNMGRTFRAPSATHPFATLTTPVVYFSSYNPEDTAPHRGMTFRYHADARGFIVGAYGYDYDGATGGDLPWAAPFAGFDNPAPPPGSMEAVFDTRLAQPSLTLLTGSAVGPGKGAYTYDPSNGAFSEGDFWRVGGKATTGGNTP